MNLSATDMVTNPNFGRRGGGSDDIAVATHFRSDLLDFSLFGYPCRAPDRLGERLPVFKKAVENRLCLPIIEYRDSMPTPEALARHDIDRQLSARGWSIQDMSGFNRYASLGVAVRVRGEAMMAVTSGQGGGRDCMRRKPN